MSLFGSLMGMADMEDDPFFGSHMRHMRQMNNMMNSMLSDPFGMFGGGGPLALTGPSHGNSLMPSLNSLFSVPDVRSLTEVNMSPGSSFSSSTVVMSSGPNGKPHVYSSTSSTKIGPNGIKETRKTLQDTRSGTKKMSVGHHIGERAHLIEREQNVYSGDAEEHQEFINIEEDEAEDFNREFMEKAGASSYGGSRRLALPAPNPAHAPRLALPPAPSTVNSSDESRCSRKHTNIKPSARRAIRRAESTAQHSRSNVREVYSSSQPQRPRHKSSKPHRHTPTDY